MTRGVHTLRAVLRPAFSHLVYTQLRQQQFMYRFWLVRFEYRREFVTKNLFFKAYDVIKYKTTAHIPM